MLSCTINNVEDRITKLLFIQSMAFEIIYLYDKLNQSIN